VPETRSPRSGTTCFRPEDPRACDGFDEPSDRVSRHPHLGDLKQNGGATKTVALLAGNPAIGRADPGTAPARDQRGVLRHDPDIGAFERR
jgi:hypothetical protein